MASQIKYTCDRCKVEIAHSAAVYAIFGAYADIKNDVCRSCLFKLKKFLKGEDV